MAGELRRGSWHPSESGRWDDTSRQVTQELGPRYQAEFSAAIPPCLKTPRGTGETGWVVCVVRNSGSQWHWQSLVMLASVEPGAASVIVSSSTKWDASPMSKLS